MKTMLFNPFNGLPRHPSDIASDPEGILMLDPDEPVKAAPTAVEPDEPGSTAEAATFTEWAGLKGYDTAHTYDTERSRWVFLNPMTADLWSAWQASTSKGTK